MFQVFLAFWLHANETETIWSKLGLWYTTSLRFRLNEVEWIPWMEARFFALSPPFQFLSIFVQRRRVLLSEDIYSNAIQHQNSFILLHLQLQRLSWRNHKLEGHGKIILIVLVYDIKNIWTIPFGRTADSIALWAFLLSSFRCCTCFKPQEWGSSRFYACSTISRAIKSKKLQLWSEIADRLIWIWDQMLSKGLKGPFHSQERRSPFAY